MNSKSVILLGLLASLLLIFLCVFFNAERYYKELGLDKNELTSVALLENNESNESQKVSEDSEDTIAEIKEEDKVESSGTEMNKETSSFSYRADNNKSFISGNLPLLDNGDSFKEFLANCSKDKSCENNVTFLDNGETLSWKDFTSSVLTIFTEEKILNPELSIDGKDIKLEGEFLEQAGKDKLSKVVEQYKEDYAIKDNTKVKEVVKKDSKKEDSTPTESTTTTEESSLKNEVKAPAKNLKSEQEKISLLLKESKITFKRNSGKIRKEGQKVLDKVVELLKGKKDILIEVEGHTDAGGKEDINLWISQARANGVKKYLIKKGIKADNITAKGYGEKRLFLPKKPYDPSNRRVEIHLKRR